MSSAIGETFRQVMNNETAVIFCADQTLYTGGIN